MKQKELLQEILLQLRCKKMVKTQGEMVIELGYGKSYFSQVMNAAEPLTPAIIARFKDKFSINPEWFENQDKPMFLESIKENSEIPNTETEIKNKQQIDNKDGEDILDLFPHKTGVTMINELLKRLEKLMNANADQSSANKTQARANEIAANEYHHLRARIDELEGKEEATKK